MVIQAACWCVLPQHLYINRRKGCHRKPKFLNPDYLSIIFILPACELPQTWDEQRRWVKHFGSLTLPSAAVCT